MEGTSLGNRHGHHVAGARSLATFGHGEVHEALVRAAAREAVSLLSLTTCLGNDHQLNGLTELLAVLFAGDAVLQGNQTLVAFLHDLLRDLVLHGRRGGAGAD